MKAARLLSIMYESFQEKLPARASCRMALYNFLDEMLTYKDVPNIERRY